MWLFLDVRFGDRPKPEMWIESIALIRMGGKGSRPPRPGDLNLASSPLYLT